MAGLILLLADERAFVLVNVLPAENPLRRQRVQLWTGRDLIDSPLTHNPERAPSGFRIRMWRNDRE